MPPETRKALTKKKKKNQKTRIEWWNHSPPPGLLLPPTTAHSELPSFYDFTYTTTRTTYFLYQFMRIFQTLSFPMLGVLFFRKEKRIRVVSGRFYVRGLYRGRIITPRSSPRSINSTTPREPPRARRIEGPSEPVYTCGSQISWWRSCCNNTPAWWASCRCRNGFGLRGRIMQEYNCPVPTEYDMNESSCTTSVES